MSDANQPKPRNMADKQYLKELPNLQGELGDLQESIKHSGSTAVTPMSGLSPKSMTSFRIRFSS